MHHRKKDKSDGFAQDAAPSRSRTHRALVATANNNNSNAPLSSCDDSRRRHHQVSSGDDGGGSNKRHGSKGKSYTENSSESEIDQGSGDSGSDEPTGSSQSRTATSNSTVSTMELRKGKWTAEEEEYTTRVIHYFSSGLIALPDGKTLRSYLAEKLMCDPMRITKKYAGASCLGKRIHNLCESPRFSLEEIEMAKLEIDRLEERFRLRLIQGPGAILPPLPSAPVIRGTMGSFTTASDQDLGCNVSTMGNILYHGGQQQQPTESIPSASAPAIEPSQTATLSSPLDNNPAAAFLASLTNHPQCRGSLSNDSDLAALLNAITQTMAAPPPSLSAAPVPAASAPSNSMTLQQILQGTMPASTTSQSVQQPIQGQERRAPSVAAAAGSQCLLPFSSNATPFSQRPHYPAEFPTSINSSNSSDNDKLAHALLAHITTQLQALAATSPSALHQFQHQLVSSTMTSNPNLWAQVSPHNNVNDPSALLKTLQQLTSPQVPAPLTQNTAYPGALPNTGFPNQSHQQAATDQNSRFHALLSQQQQAAPNQNKSCRDLAELFQILSAQHQQQQAPAQSTLESNLQSLMAAPRAAANNSPLADAYNLFMSNAAAASDKPQYLNNSTKQNLASSTSFQTQQSAFSHADALSHAISNAVKESQGQSIAGSNMDELIDNLRKNHAEVISQELCNAAERKHNSPVSFQQVIHGRESPESPVRKRSNLTSQECMERFSLMGRESASIKIDAQNLEGQIIKKRAKWSSKCAGFQHIDRAADVSSKSGSSSQVDTEESKSTSSGDNPESDETKHNWSTSGTSLSDEGDEDHRAAVPSRKRFKKPSSHGARCD